MSGAPVWTNCKDCGKRIRKHYPSGRCYACGMAIVSARAIANAEARFWRKVRKTEGCWLWTGVPGASGYGLFSLGYRRVAAHRYSFELVHGAIGVGLFVLHHCDYRLCVNPDHLFLGTIADNNRDAALKGRMHERLSAEQVVALRSRKLAGEPTVALAREYGIHPATVRKIARGLKRPHVPMVLA